MTEPARLKVLWVGDDTALAESIGKILLVAEIQLVPDLVAAESALQATEPPKLLLADYGAEALALCQRLRSNRNSKLMPAALFSSWKIWPKAAPSPSTSPLQSRKP